MADSNEIILRDLQKLEDRVNQIEKTQAEFMGAWRAQYADIIRRMEEGSRDRAQHRIDLADAIGSIRQLFEQVVTKTETLIKDSRSELKAEVIRIQSETRTEITVIRTETASEVKAIQNWANKVVISCLTFATTTLLGILLKYLKVI